MPAVDPERLAKQLEHLASLGSNSKEIRRSVLDLLEFYADRTKRPSGTIGADEGIRSFRVPKPVLRRIRSALLQSVAENPDAAQAVAEALWISGYREPRLFAIALLGAQGPPHTIERVENWVVEADDPVVLTELAEVFVLSDDGKIDTAYQERIAIWLRKWDPMLQQFALLILLKVVQTPNFDDLPYIFQHLNRMDEVETQGSQGSFNLLMEELVKKSPSETAQYIMDEVKRNKTQGMRMIRDLFDYFPPDEQARLKSILSGP